MSDPETDDTDALLAYKPPTFGAIENFLGLSLGEISNKINSLSCGDSPKTPNNNHVSEEKEPSPSTTFDSSDFFNSKGELVLSGLSEWSDSGDDSDDANSDTGSVASSASTNSITVVRPDSLPEAKQKSKRDESPVHENRGDDACQIELEDKLKQLQLNGGSGIDEADKDVGSNRENVIDENLNIAVKESKSKELNASDIAQHMSNSSGNLIQFSFDKYKSPNYGVRYSPGFGRQGINVLVPSANSGWRVPPGLEDDPQIFTRAPNFRTPGGYRPPLNPKPPRDLTAEQIEEEVKNMYAFPEDNENEGENKDESISIVKSKSGRQVSFLDDTESETEDCDKNDEGTSSSGNGTSELEKQIIPEEEVDYPSPSLQFDFTNGSIEPPEFGGKGIAMKGKPIKRKLIPGGGDCGNTVESIPNLNFGLRDLSKLEVKERPITRTRTWVSGNENTQAQGKELVLASQFNGNSHVASPGQHKQKRVNFSDLDKLWRDIRDTKLEMDKEVKKTTNNLKALSFSEGMNPAGTHALNIDFDQDHSINLSGNVSSEGSKSELCSIPKSDNPHYFVTKETGENSQPSFQNVRVVKKPSSEKQKLKSNSVSCLAGRSIDPYKKSGANIDELPKDKFETLSESDLDSILKEADIEIDDFEDILDKFSEEMPIDELFGAAAAYSKNELGEEMVYSLEQADISDWAKSGAGEYLEKFHEEKYKRQRCESEIETLQKELLELKQQNAVLDGGLKKKDAMFLHISMAWNRLSKDWKNHDAVSKSALAKLQKDQQALIAACRQSKERILQYEKELARAVEVADTFKAKIHEIESEKAESLQSSGFENKKLSEKAKQLELLLEECQNEKDATVRALRDAHMQLDERKSLEEKVHREIIELEKKTVDTAMRFDKVSEQKETVENQLKTVSSIKNSLETQINNLHEELRVETASKSRLEKELETTIVQKVKQESDRLHEYYNKKVQEILSAATEKAASVEASLLNNMQKAAAEADQRLQNCKSRYKAEMDSMKLKYENEMHALIRENSQKQQLITATAQQLQTGELAISQTTDRLHNIVSNIVKPQPVNIYNSNGVGLGQRRGSESNGVPLSYQILNGYPSKHSLPHHQSQTLPTPSTSTAESSPGFQGNFEHSHFTRYNTSTPVVSLPSKSNVSQSSGDSSLNLKLSRPEFHQQRCLPPLDHLLSNPKLLHVITEMSVSSGQGKSKGQGSVVKTRSSSATCSQLINPHSLSFCGDKGEVPFISSHHHHKIKNITQFPAAYMNTVDVEPPIAAEIPVRLENTPREGPEIMSTATQLNNYPDHEHPNPNRAQTSLSHQQAILEPGLHKCLQALVKCYAQKLDHRLLDGSKTSDSENESPPSGLNKNKHSHVTHNLANDNEPDEFNKSHHATIPENKNTKLSKESSQTETNVQVDDGDTSHSKTSAKNNSFPHNSKRPWK